jgi:hypothetical protein
LPLVGIAAGIATCDAPRTIGIFHASQNASIEAWR